jgi:hypothetical protein
VFRASYLNGEHSDTGFGSYFFWTFLFKTPIVTLLLIAVALFTPHRALTRFAWVAIIIYLLIAVRANLNIGHRHLLPIYPFLFLICGAVAVRWSRFSVRTRVVAAAIVLPLIVLTGLRGDRLSYLNELAGGPDRGYRHLVDSNYDWGQDLPKLGEWLDANHETGPINLCYFGTADPRFYGIRHRNLFLGYEYEPDDGFAAVTPGLLAISATNLVGNGWEPQAREDWRRFMEAHGATPVGRAGRSIVIYRLSR